MRPVAGIVHPPRQRAIGRLFHATPWSSSLVLHVKLALCRAAGTSVIATLADGRSANQPKVSPGWLLKGGTQTQSLAGPVFSRLTGGHTFVL
jgi:hypothetical protein